MYWVPRLPWYFQPSHKVLTFPVETYILNVQKPNTEGTIKPFQSYYKEEGKGSNYLNEIYIYIYHISNSVLNLVDNPSLKFTIRSNSSDRFFAFKTLRETWCGKEFF